MTDKEYTQHCELETRLENDEELKHLKQRLQETSGQVRTLMSQLTEEQRSILTEYLGTCAEADQRIVELACFCDK